MNSRKRYVKRETEFIVAVRLDLDTEGFDYRKWGEVQRCKAGDWLVNNGGDTYTVEHEAFERTYRAIAPGRYLKTTPVWAEIASSSGVVRTKEGTTHYEAGDYLVWNDEGDSDTYAVSKKDFERMYQPVE